MESLFGGLFDVTSKNEIDAFLNSIDEKYALKMIELSIIHAQQNGLFTLAESTIIYKSLNILKDKISQI